MRATFVPGHARPKGSLDQRMQDTPQSKLWRRIVAKHVGALGWPVIDGPCVVEMVFWFDPASVGGLKREDIELGDMPIHPHIGDLDKLVRNVLDALQVDRTGRGNGAGVIADDRQVVGLASTRKLWARPWMGERAGLALSMWPVGRVAP